MSSYAVPNVKGFIADADLSAKQYHFVKLGTDAKHVNVAGANERAIGILLNKPESGQRCEVALIGGGAKLKVSETIALGKLLTSTAAGQGEVADAAGEWVSAIAMNSGVADDIIDVLIIAMQAQASDA